MALCCEFAEYTPEEIASNYDIDISECEDEDEIRDTVMDYLQENTQVCGETSDSIVYMQFWHDPHPNLLNSRHPMALWLRGAGFYNLIKG